MGEMRKKVLALNPVSDVNAQEHQKAKASLSKLHAGELQGALKIVADHYYSKANATTRPG